MTVILTVRGRDPEEIASCLEKLSELLVDGYTSGMRWDLSEEEVE